MAAALAGATACNRLYYASMEKLGKEKRDILVKRIVDGKKDQEEAIGGELKDLKIDGDKATATLVRKKGGKDAQEPIEFRKVGGGWKLELPERPMGGPALKGP